MFTSGCEYQGNFYAFQSSSNNDGHMDLSYVKSNNLISFFDLSDPNGKNFKSKYGKKTITITAGIALVN